MSWALGAGLAATGLSAFMGNSSQKRANRANQRRYQQGLDSIAEHERFLSDLFGGIEGTLREGGAQEAAGYDQALASVLGSGASATAGVLDRQRQTIGEADQVMARRGLYSTSAAIGLRRGLAADASREIGRIEAGVGQQRAGLQVGKGQAGNRMHTAIATLLAQRGGIQTQLLGQKLEWLFNRQDRPGAGPLDHISAGLNAAGAVANILKE